MVFAACEKTPEPEPQPQPDPTPDPTPEYVVDMEMVAGVRTTEIPEYEMVFADNQFMLTFVDETQAHTLTLFIFGDEGEKTLQAGTYTEEDMEMAYSAYLYGEEAVQFDKANVVVAVKTNVYDIEAVLLMLREVSITSLSRARLSTWTLTRSQSQAMVTFSTRRWHMHHAYR